MREIESSLGMASTQHFCCNHPNGPASLSLSLSLSHAVSHGQKKPTPVTRSEGENEAHLQIAAIPVRTLFPNKKIGPEFNIFFLNLFYRKLLWEGTRVCHEIPSLPSPSLPP